MESLIINNIYKGLYIIIFMEILNPGKITSEEAATKFDSIIGV